MGLVAGQAQILMLTAYKSDLELKMQQISNRRMQLASASSQAMNNESATAQLQNIDKQLEMQMKIYENQEKAIEATLESAGKVVENSAKAMKYMG
jgi:hypothetical protein